MFDSKDVKFLLFLLNNIKNNSNAGVMCLYKETLDQAYIDEKYLHEFIDKLQMKLKSDF